MPGKDQCPQLVPTQPSSHGGLSPREERHQLLPDSPCYWRRPAASPLQAFPQQRQICFEAGKGSFSTGKDFRSRYAALLNLPFDPWGKGQFGSWKTIVCLSLQVAAKGFVERWSELFNYTANRAVS